MPSARTSKGLLHITYMPRFCRYDALYLQLNLNVNVETKFRLYIVNSELLNFNSIAAQVHILNILKGGNLKKAISNIEYGNFLMVLFIQDIHDVV